MRIEVESIDERELHRRVPRPGRADEIGRLADTMNNMLVRLEGAAVRSRRFLADASHELRSPLAGIRSQLELDLAHPDRSDWQRTERQQCRCGGPRLGRVRYSPALADATAWRGWRHDCCISDVTTRRSPGRRCARSCAAWCAGASTRAFAPLRRRRSRVERCPPPLGSRPRRKAGPRRVRRQRCSRIGRAQSIRRPAISEDLRTPVHGVHRGPFIGRRCAPHRESGRWPATLGRDGVVPSPRRHGVPGPGLVDAGHLLRPTSPSDEPVAARGEPSHPSPQGRVGDHQQGLRRRDHLGPSYRVETLNVAAEALYGWNEAESTKKTSLDLIPWAADDVDLAGIQEILISRGYWHGDVELVGRDGETVDVHISAAMMGEAADHHAGVVLVSRPVRVARLTPRRRISARRSAGSRRCRVPSALSADREPRVSRRDRSRGPRPEMRARRRFTACAPRRDVEGRARQVPARSLRPTPHRRPRPDHRADGGHGRGPAPEVQDGVAGGHRMIPYGGRVYRGTGGWSWQIGR